jgi:hypothetical protein
MDGIKRRFVLAMLLGMLGVSAHAKTSDTPVFGVWSAQRGGQAGVFALERLPCPRGEKGACNSPLLSALSARGRGAVDPFQRSTARSQAKRHHVVFKNTKRVKTTARSDVSTRRDMRAFARSGSVLVLNDTANQLFDIDFDAPGETAPAQLDVLAALVSDVSPVPLPDTPLLDTAAGGLGDSAYVALYDFDDEMGGAGESGVQEISSLVSARSLLAANVAVPEPGTLVLVGVGLLALRLRWRRGQSHTLVGPDCA